jgi:hypothetical protein
MRVTVVGATVPAKTLRAACAKAEVASKDVRVVGPRAWVQLPVDARDATLSRLAEALATGLMVIDVDLAAGGDSIAASRSTFRGVEEDISSEARELLDGRRAAGKRVDDDGAASVDGDGAASELAWALIGAADGASTPAEPTTEDLWAQALVDKLVADGMIELRGTDHTPVGRVSQILQSPGRDLGDRLLAELIDSTAVDEVFADADQLSAAAKITRKR